MGSDTALTMVDTQRRTPVLSWTPVILSLLLLTDSYCKSALHKSVRTRRQAYSDSDYGDPDIASVVSNFLQADPDTQQDYLRYGVELAEYHLLQSYDGLKDKTNAQDRVFLDSVQSLIDAVQSISSDPGQTPAALAALATNPGNLLLFTSLVVSTVFVAQLSSLALFGTSLSGASLKESEEGEQEEVTGLMGIVMGIIPSLLVAITEFITGITQENRVFDVEDTLSENCTNPLFPCNEHLDYLDTVEDEKVFDTQEEDEQQPGGLFDPLINFIHNFIIIRHSDDDESTSEESNEDEGQRNTTGSSGSEEEDDGGIHLGVDVAPGSVLDVIVNLLPIPDVNDLEEDTIQEVSEPEEDQGTTTFGGASISLHPIDLANLFIQVQNLIGVNCTCQDALTDDAITQATLRLLEENMEEINKYRQYSTLKDTLFDQGSSKRKKGKKGGRERRVTGRIPKSLINRLIN